MAVRRFDVPRPKLPPSVTRHTDRISRGALRRPRITGFLVGLLGLLLLLPLSWLVFGGTDLGESGPTHWGYLDE